MPSGESSGFRRISVDLPNEYIERFDALKQAWGLRRRGAVIERLLETLFDEQENKSAEIDLEKVGKSDYIQLEVNSDEDKSYIDDTAIVLIETNKVIKLENDPVIEQEEKYLKPTISKLSEIDLPGFVRNKTENLKRSLSKSRNIETNYDYMIKSINESDVNIWLQNAISHWISLYGSKPKEEVIEAAMIWIARDIWPYLDDTDNLPFTWNASTKLIKSLCPFWNISLPSFESIIVMAGVLEDPFATKTLQNRIPTLIRRFVNSFKRRSNVTSFQTLESTMTVHGALKLLELPTTAGKSVSLSSVREAYKTKALDNHPDSGGSTETMRKINEAYQLLKDLYKRKS